MFGIEGAEGISRSLLSPFFPVAEGALFPESLPSLHPLSGFILSLGFQVPSLVSPFPDPIRVADPLLSSPPLLSLILHCPSLFTPSLSFEFYSCSIEFIRTSPPSPPF